MAPEVAFEPFRPRPPWLNGHLQTVRNLLRPAVRLPGGPGRRLLLPLGDGTRDRLAARLDEPARRVEGAPLVVVLHGLAGCETSRYVLATAAHFAALGWPVLRLSMRGSPPSRAYAAGFGHAGKSEDLRGALPGVRALLAPSSILLLGYSLGGNLLLKAVGEGGLPPEVRAAAAVSAPLDLAEASDLLLRPRNRGYHAYLLRATKRGYLAPPAALAAGTLRAVRESRTLAELDDRVTAPLNGFAGVDDYYARASCRPYLARVTVPTLAIHAEDDPFVPNAPYERLGPSPFPALRVLLSTGGGHVGFHDRRGLWHLRQVERFFRAACAAAPV